MTDLAVLTLCVIILVLSVAVVSLVSLWQDADTRVLREKRATAQQRRRRREQERLAAEFHDRARAAEGRLCEIEADNPWLRTNYEEDAA